MRRNETRGLRDSTSKILPNLPKILKKLSKKRREAFTLTEILIAMIIVMILGGAAIAALWLFFASFSQIDDLTRAEFELNIAIQRLTRDFAMIGLGVPNNSGRAVNAGGVNIGAPPGEMRAFSDSFAWSFRGAPDVPVTAFFGLAANPERGGPVTVTTGPVANPANIAGLANLGMAGGPNRPLFIGSDLHYAFGVPTGVMAQIQGNATIGRGDDLIIAPVVNNAYNTLRNVSWDGRAAGVQAVADGDVTSANTRAWILLPTLRIPLLVREIANPTGNMTVTAAPGAPAGAPDMDERLLMSLDEIHVMQAARIYRSQRPDQFPNQLRRRNLATPAADSDEVLARNIVGLQFAFDPQSRVLMMFIAARGDERNPTVGVGQHNWPAWLPEQIDDDDLEFRIVTKTLTWRIVN